MHAALDLVSRKGIGALTAKELGNALGSSVRPIFSVFSDMKEVRDAACNAAMRRFEDFMRQKKPARRNRNAIKLEDVFGRLGSTPQTCIALIREEYGMSESDAKRLPENVWICTFVVGASCATCVCRFSEEQTGRVLSTQFQAMLLAKSRTDKGM